MRVRVKVCCISSVEEAQLATQFGADALGLVAQMPSGPGVISEFLISSIAKASSPGVNTFLLSSETKAERLIEQYQRVNTTAIQLVDSVSPNIYFHVKKALPHVKLVQVIHVLNESSINEAISVAPHVDALLLDSGNPNLDIKILGGTGKVHNWELSKAIVQKVTKPVFLAGGINATNAKKAIDVVQPYGLDLCSGVRSNGKLDIEKLRAFFTVVL